MILAIQEALDMLRLPSAEDSPQLLRLLEFVDDFIETATGRDWGSDNPIDPTAWMLAAALLVRWHDDPGQMGNISDNDIGVKALMGQLHAKALELAEEAVW